MSIKDYLTLKEIYYCLKSESERQLRENNGFSNIGIDKIIILEDKLRKIIEKLEDDDNG